MYVIVRAINRNIRESDNHYIFSYHPEDDLRWEIFINNVENKLHYDDFLSKKLFMYYQFEKNLAR